MSSLLRRKSREFHYVLVGAQMSAMHMQACMHVFMVAFKYLLGTRLGWSWWQACKAFIVPWSSTELILTKAKNLITMTFWYSQAVHKKSRTTPQGQGFCLPPDVPTTAGAPASQNKGSHKHQLFKDGCLAL